MLKKLLLFGFVVLFVSGCGYVDTGSKIDCAKQQVEKSFSVEPRVSAAEPEIKKVTVIGDSLSVGFADYLPDRFTVLGKIGRQFDEGIYIAETNQLEAVVIIELGTNGTIQHQDMEYLIGILSGKQVYFVTNYMDRSWEEGNNQCIWSFASQNENVHVIDWNGYACNNPWVISGDGVHCTPEGYVEMANFIQSNIK